jgi:hypothetical protein
MTHPRPTLLAALVLAVLLALPGQGQAQIYTSVGAGVANPMGDFGDLADSGFTLRGQAGLSLVLADVHLQAGYSRFPGREFTFGGDTFEVEEDFNQFHVGAGGRLGLGLIWVGASGVYMFGDGIDEVDFSSDGIAFLPEIGVGLGPIEVVADYLLHSDVNWIGLRAAFKF